MVISLTVYNLLLNLSDEIVGGYSCLGCKRALTIVPVWRLRITFTFGPNFFHLV